MASTLKDPPFTGTFHSDILLLSSLLHGQQDAHCKARPRDTKNAALSLVTHIATLLTTSNPRDPSISYDHAVTGHVEQLLIQCFVFIKNFQSKLTSQNDSRGPETHQLVPLAVDIENGRNLLLSWDSRTSDSSFDVHVRDVFDIIRYLQTDQKRERDLLNFLLFAHSRGWRALRLCVLHFSHHWGSLPFELIKKHSDAIAKHPGLAKEFLLSLDSIQNLIFRKFDVQGESPFPLDPTESPVCCYKFRLEPSNISNWIELFIGVWQALEGELPEVPEEREFAAPRPADILIREMLSSGPDNGVSSKSSATASDSLRIPLICLLIGTLHALRPVLKHILSNLDRESLFALENAETYVEDVRRSNMNRCGERIDEVSEGICYDGRDESEFNKEYYENDANRVIRSFDRVIAWHSAVVSIWTQGSRWFSGKDLRVYQFSYDPTGPVDPSSSQLHTILHQIDQDRHWRDSDVQALRGKAMLASVHPEAALMCWASFTASRTLLNASESLPVGVSTKCCRLCWLLQEMLNSENCDTPSFVLPGMHTTFYSWIPPPGLPEHILHRLRNKLLEAIRFSKALHSDSQNDSDTESAPNLVVHYQSIEEFLDALERMERMERPEAL